MGELEQHRHLVQLERQQHGDVRVGRDKLGAHGSHVEFFTDTGAYSSESRASLSRRLVRCDSATYIYADWQQGCVFLETIPRMMYSRAADSPHKEVADHIYKAQNQPDPTYPTSAASKNIPVST